MHKVRCAIGLGGNLGDAVSTLSQALVGLAQSPGCTLIAASALYRSSAIGPAGQPDYANAVAALETTLSPWALLDLLQALENQAGRLRELRWGARTLDLDLLLYGEHNLGDSRLTVPHPEMLARAFVLRPLLDIQMSMHWPQNIALASLLEQPMLAQQTLSVWPAPHWLATRTQHCLHLWSTS